MRKRVCLNFLTTFSLLFIQGCSLNEYGLVTQQRFELPGAQLSTVEAFGVHLDTRSDDPSITFGLFEAQYIYSDICSDLGNISSLETSALLKRALPQVQIEDIYGLSIKFGQGEVGVTVGYRQFAQLLKIDSSSSISRTIDVNFDALERSRLSYLGNCAK